jgi:hypothetical protein
VAEHNPWVRDSIDELRAIADRADSALFSKEASFQAHRMQTRLAARDEANGSHRFAKVAAYLRRKTNQGKGDEQPPP